MITIVNALTCTNSFVDYFLFLFFTISGFKVTELLCTPPTQVDLFKAVLVAFLCVTTEGQSLTLSQALFIRLINQRVAYD